MKILYLKTVASTQIYLKDIVKKEKLALPLAVVSDMQTNGIGSRDNSWTAIEGNLFLSFAIELKNLPIDLKIESSSIYFAYILKDTLRELDSDVWLKWPNDFYLNDLKIGGMITNIVNDTLICGVGLNLVDSPNQFGSLDIRISKELLLENYFQKLEKTISWKQVFSKYKLEFHKNKEYFTHNNNLKISLDDATLCSDGSILNKGVRMYSLR